MRVIVLGAGVIGVTTAYQLARNGCEVVVIDRQLGAGLETSFANGGQISASHAEPWASPTTIARMIQWLGQPDAPLVFHWMRWDPHLLTWLGLFLRNCTTTRANRNMERALRLALYSRKILKSFREEIGITYNHSNKGILHIYRTQRAFDRACSFAETMQSLGLNLFPHSVSACLDLEPSLTDASPTLVGGLYSPEDESGDAYLFTSRLADLAQKLGVNFLFDTTVYGLEVENSRIVRVITSRGSITGTVYILALGSYSVQVARTIGLNLAIYPAKGYSITLDTAGFSKTPSVSITDDEHKMVYTRLNSKLRIAGTAELVGWDDTVTASRVNALLKHAHQLFPGGGDYSQAKFWAGLRPKTPDSVPLIGRTRWSNLFLNTGHGTLGWTMAIGSAYIITDLVVDRPTSIRLSGLEQERFEWKQ